MKWTTALRTLEEVGARCAHMSAQPATIVPLRVSAAWVHGDLLGPRRDDVGDLDGVSVALAVNAGQDECAWLTQPRGAGQWLAASALEKRPVRLFFRSEQAPVWNHRIERPVRFWTPQDGLDAAVLDAVREGRGEDLRPPAPAPGELAARLDAELAVSLLAVRRTSADYDEHRWAPGSPLKRADALAAAAGGYVDLLDARGSVAP